MTCNDTHRNDITGHAKPSIKCFDITSSFLVPRVRWEWLDRRSDPTRISESRASPRAHLRIMRTSAESCAPPHTHPRIIRIPAYASHTYPRTRIPAYASPQTKYAYAHPHSKPKSSRLRAHVEVALRRDFIHAQGFHVPRRVQHFRGARALVQGNNLGFVPHPVVGPVELGFFNWSCEGVNGGVKVGKVSWGRSAGDEKAIVFGKTKLPKNCQNLGW